MEEDSGIWRDWIRVFLEDLEKKAAFLKELYEKGNKDEALLLCCCYIDGLANNLYGGKRSNKNFIRAMEEFGEEKHWGLIHPDQLIRNMLRACTPSTKENKPLKILVEKIKENPSIFDWKLFSDKEIIQGITLQINLTQKEISLLKKNLWRGKFANIVYDQMRTPFVHRLGIGGSHAFFFSKTIHNGGHLPPLDFDGLYPILKRILWRGTPLNNSVVMKSDCVISKGLWENGDVLPFCSFDEKR